MGQRPISPLLAVSDREQRLYTLSTVTSSTDLERPQDLPPFGEGEVGGHDLR